MKSPLAIILSVSLGSMLYGQQPTPLEEKLDESVTGQPATGEASDVGAQTPVEVGGAVSSYAGVDLRYLYRDNSLSVSGPTNIIKSGIIMHTFYAGAILPSKPLGSGVLTPFMGVSRTDVHHDNEDLEVFDNAAESAYLLWQYQLAGGYTLRAGMELGRSLNTEANTQDYRDYHTNVSLLKFIPLENGHSLLATIKTGVHQTKVPAAAASFGYTSDRLDSWETSGTLQYSFSPLDKLTARPFVSLSYKKYEEDLNDDRDDLTVSYGVSASYDVKPWLQIVGSVVGIDRESEGLEEAEGFYNPNMANEFENWDAGVGINLNYSF